jgi:glycyl-tRNA synthetase alpha chain
MYLQGVENVYDLVWTERENGKTVRLSYGDVFHQNEVEQSTFNFEYSNTDFLFSLFTNYEAEAKRLTEVTRKSLALPVQNRSESRTHIQSARCTRGDFGDRACRVYWPHP